MKINEKSVEKLLKDIKDDLKSAYTTGDKNWKDLNIIEAIGKVDALLTVVEFE